MGKVSDVEVQRLIWGHMSCNAVMLHRMTGLTEAVRGIEREGSVEDEVFFFSSSSSSFEQSSQRFLQAFLSFIRRCCDCDEN